MGRKAFLSRDFQFASSSANGRPSGLNFRRSRGLILLRPAHHAAGCGGGQRIRQHGQSHGRARTGHLPGDPVQVLGPKPARFLSEGALPRPRPHRAAGRQAQALQARRAPLRENQQELRILRGFRPRPHHRQIRPHGLSLGRTNSFFLGGGRSMLNAIYLTAERLGVEVEYDAEVVDLEIEGGTFRSATVARGPERVAVRASALVAAAGGFEANIEWLKEYWGPPADNFLIRGTPYNRGTVLKMLLDNGVEPVGDPTQCHAVAIDARAPKFDGGIITRLDCVVFGIVVNKHAQRFYDEGEDI